jgi:hypothetical protein
MKKLWHDIHAHERASVLFLVYWLATLAVILRRSGELTHLCSPKVTQAF